MTKPGRYCDGHGLYLLVTDTGARCWVQRLTIHGRRRELGLGGFPLVSLAEAREQAATPLAEKRKDQGMPTFEDAAARVIEIHRPSWKKGGKSAAQWASSLREYVFPRSVSDVTTADVMAVLTPIWHEKPETARPKSTSGDFDLEDEDEELELTRPLHREFGAQPVREIDGQLSELHHSFCEQRGSNVCWQNDLSPSTHRDRSYARAIPINVHCQDNHSSMSSSRTSSMCS